MNKKLKVYLPITILSVILVVSAVVLGIMTIGKNNNKTTDKQALNSNYMTLNEIDELEEKVNELTEEEIIALKEEAKNGVKDELTLRMLLLLEDEIEIKVLNSMELIVGMKVNGTKTLTGDAILKMFLGSERNTAQDGILMVSRGATLDMKGLVLDGNGVCNAILVKEGANLNYNEGTVQYGIPYGIFNMGTTYVNGGTITKCMAAGVGTATSSKTYVVGGNLKDNYKNHIWTAVGSNIEVTGGVFDHSYSHAIHNLGTLKMTGGTIKNSNTADACAVANFGKAYIDGGDDYIEISNCVTGFFSEKDTMEVNKVYGHDMVRNFLRIKDGKGKVTNCKIERTGTYAVRAGGEVTIENIYAENLGSHGIYTSPGKVTVKNVEVKNAGEYGFVNCGAEVVATDITITRAGTSAFINYDSTFNGKGEKGLLTLKDCTATECKSNLIVRGGTSVKVSECVFNKTVRTNVHVTEGNADLKNVQLLGSTDVDCSIISIRKDSKATLDNVEMAYGNRGISLAGKVTVTGGSIHDNKGELAGNAVRAEDNAVYKLEGVKIYNNHNTSEKMAGGVSFMAKGSHGTIIDCEITNNSSVRTVGGIYAEEAELNIKNTVFKNNETTGADGDGGAILLQKTKSVIRECTFEENKAGTDYKNVGGAIYCKTDSNLAIIACKFKGNVAGRGGAIANVGTLTISEGTTFTENTCTEGGAGVYNGGNGIVTDTGSIYEKNTLTEVHAGGAIRNDGANTQYILRDAVLSENSSKGNGGAIFSNGLTFDVTKCTFKNNKAEQGGAIYNKTKTTLVNVVIDESAYEGDAGSCIYVAKKGTLSLDDVKMNNIGTGKDSHAIFNNGGTVLGAKDAKQTVAIENVKGHGIVNMGDGTIELVGVSIKDVNGSERNAVYSDSGFVNLKNIAIQNVTKDAIYVKGGTATIEDAVIENIQRAAITATETTDKDGKTTATGEVTLKNVTVKEPEAKAAQYGIYCVRGKVNVDNVNIANTGSTGDDHAVLNNGGIINTVKGAEKSLTIANTTGYGIANTGDGSIELFNASIQGVTGLNRHAVYSDSGLLTIKNVVIKDVTNDVSGVEDKKDGIHIKGGKASIENAVIENVKRAAITATEKTDKNDDVIATSDVTLKNVIVKLSEDAEVGARSAQYGIYCVRGKVNVDNVNIANTGSTGDDHAVLNNGGIVQTAEGAETSIHVTDATGNGIANIGKGTIKLTGVTVQNVVKKGISSDSGTVTVENVTIKNADDGIYLKPEEVSGILSVTNATIEDVTRGVAIAKGKVIAEKVTVKKATEEGAKVHTHGVFVYSSDSTAELKDVTVEDATTAGVYAEKGAVLANKLILKRGAKAIYNKAGVVGTEEKPVTDVVIEKTSGHGIHVEQGTLYIDGLKISNDITKSGKGIAIQSGTASIKNAEINGTKDTAVYIGVKSNAAADVTLEKIKIQNSAKYGIQLDSGSVTTTLKNITIDSVSNGISFNGGTHQVNEINITGTDKCVEMKKGTVTGDITVTPTAYTVGGTVVTKAGSATDDMVKAVSKLIRVTPDSNGETWFVNDAGKLTKYAIKNGDKSYINLADAVSEAKENDTLTLLENVSVSSTITVNQSITITSSKAVEINGNAKDVHLFDVTSGKTLKIQGASETAKITIKKDQTKNVINNNGTVQLKNVVIDGGRLGINNASGTLNVENAVVKNTSNKGVAIAGGNATLKNTTIQDAGASGLYIYSNAKTVELNNVTVKNVSGDTNQHGITIQKGTVTVKNSLYVENVVGHGIAVTGGTLTTDSATNGTIRVNGSDRAGIYASVGINVAVTSISDCSKDIGVKNATITINGKSKKVGNTTTYYSLNEF